MEHKYRQLIDLQIQIQQIYCTYIYRSKQNVINIFSILYSMHTFHQERNLYQNIFNKHKIYITF